MSTNELIAFNELVKIVMFHLEQNLSQVCSKDSSSEHIAEMAALLAMDAVMKAGGSESMAFLISNYIENHILNNT